MADRTPGSIPGERAAAGPAPAEPGGPASAARDGSPSVRGANVRSVLAVAAGVVAAVLGLAVATSFLPADLQAIVFRTPLAIVVIGVGTVGLLVRLAFRPSR